jgi:DNA polymerase III delta prime subunit
MRNRNKNPSTASAAANPSGGNGGNVVFPTYVLSGFPKDVTLAEIQGFLPVWVQHRIIQLGQLQRRKRTSLAQLQFPEQPLSQQQYEALCHFFVTERFRDVYIVTIGPLKQPEGKKEKQKAMSDAFAREVWELITTEKGTFICDRDNLSIYFRELCNSKNELRNLSRRQLKSKEFVTIKRMRQLRLVRTVRANNFTVLTLLANPNDLQFPTNEEQDAARERLGEELEEAKSNKEGVMVSELPDRILGSIGETELIRFEVQVDALKTLSTVNMRGASASMFRLAEATNAAFPLPISPPAPGSTNTTTIELTVVPNRIGVVRTKVYFVFDGFVIVRAITMSCGHREMNEILQPTAPYQRLQRKYVRHSNKDTVGPPKPENQSGGAGGRDANPFKHLSQYMVPPDIMDSIRVDGYDLRMDSIAWKNSPSHDSVEDYGVYWQHLLYASEHQMRRDIQLYDMENVSLQRDGRYFLLAVPGLAEGRPSVLRGDLVHISFQNCLYKGRVISIRQFEVVMDLHAKFSRNFNAALDRVSVRFTFSRTALRTSHRACENLAEPQLGAAVLMPTRENVVNILEKDDKVVCPICLVELGGDVCFTTMYCRGQCRAQFHEGCIQQWLLGNPTCPMCRESWNGGVASNNRQKAATAGTTLSPWANRTLNAEQQAAVQRIANGALRPLPYIIFGPPGTGKTTTVVEAIYQLGKQGKKILLVAPSNDAADILVERLASYYPPSELRRILAYSRSIDTLPASIRSYASDGVDYSDQTPEILSAQIVVSTVNLAARFSFFGIPRGHFEVLCVDEAGHATEPEVIAVAASLMNSLEGSDPIGQLILAGDPKQLGPISTSDICLKYGLSVSYMERLTDRSVYQPQADGQYPKDLLTKLVRNYRSHPAILKLPNEMFYKDLKCCGDIMVTSNMVRWEHLPKPGFPVVFHAMAGENLREGNSPSWFNPEEAQQVVEYVRLLTRETRPRLQGDEIGIITPYARQAQKIRSALRTQDIDDIKVGSVESFQGQERRVIIVSTVRAEREQVSSDLRYNLGFVANPKRFNVAVTRAKALLIVIGSPSVLAMDKDNWLPFMKFCHDNNSWVGDDWDPASVADNDNDALGEVDSGSSSDDFEDVDGPSQAAQQEEFVFISREE